MPPLSPSDRRLVAATLRRAADRVATEGERMNRRPRGKGTVERSAVWVEQQTIDRVVGWLRRWADVSDPGGR